MMRWWSRKRAQPQAFRFAWLTDIHLNFLGVSALQNFFSQVAELDVQAYVISGDIGESNTVCDYLKALSHTVQRPVYFVLGNHDFYRSGVAQVRQEVIAKLGDDSYLRYLTAAEPLELTPDTALVGHDGWADGRYGDFLGSTMMLNDYILIRELAQAFERGHESLWKALQQLADEAAQQLSEQLEQALNRYPLVFVMLHPPPFVENTLYNGMPSPANSLPHFSSKAAGDVLLTMADRYPQKRMIVLCGHTHVASESYLRPNLQVLSGAAEYRAPTVQRIFSVE
jgi:3',5'-cyclic-AMP phosphodiesterase